MDEAILTDIGDMIRRPITSELLSHVSEQAALVIPCQQMTQMSSVVDSKYGALPSLPTFINFLVKRSSVRTGTLLGSLVFLQRLQQTLSTIAKGMPCTSHRIFLATLIVTSKALHDTSPKNKHWAKYAAYFTLSEINLMEKQLLSLMNYHVLISPADLSNAYYKFKQTSVSLPPTLSYKPTMKILSKPVPAVLSITHDTTDLPTYAVMYSNLGQLPSLAGSTTSLSSTDSDESSVATLDEETNVMMKFYNQQQPPKAHCRDRKNISEEIWVNDSGNDSFLRNNNKN